MKCGSLGGGRVYKHSALYRICGDILKICNTESTLLEQNHLTWSVEGSHRSDAMRPRYEDHWRDVMSGSSMKSGLNIQVVYGT